MILGLGRLRGARADDLAVMKRTGHVLLLLSHLHIADKTVLEIGCGNGVHIISISRLFKRAIGIDIRQDSLRYAKELTIDLNASAKFVRANAECLPFRDMCFDVALVLEVLEHVQAPRNVLKEAAQSLKSKGYLVISVPNRRYPLEMHGMRIGKTVLTGFHGSIPFFSWAPRFARKKFEIARIYSKKEITEIIEDSGLVVRQVQYSIFPRLDRLGSKRITDLCDKFFTPLESNIFFKQFGMSIFVLAQKR